MQSKNKIRFIFVYITIIIFLDFINDLYYPFKKEVFYKC